MAVLSLAPDRGAPRPINKERLKERYLFMWVSFYPADSFRWRPGDPWNAVWGMSLCAGVNLDELGIGRVLLD